MLAKFFPYQVLSIFTNDEAVIREGMRYFEIVCWTYIIFSISNSLMYALQSVETAMVGTVMSVSTIIINICLNYCFIYGNFGAAVATLISRIVELVIISIYILFIDKKLQMKLRDLLRFDFTYVSDYFKVAMPVIISGGLWGVAQGAQTAVLGHIGATVIAANSIAVIIFQIFAVFGLSCANVGSVVMGKTVGEGLFDKVRSYSKTMQMIISLYSVSEETKQLALQFITVLSIATIGSCYEYPVEGGIIAGGGSTKYQAYIDNLFMWLFTIPSAFLSAFVFNFPPLVTFCFLKADQLIKCIPNFITCNRYRWVKVLTRDE